SQRCGESRWPWRDPPVRSTLVGGTPPVKARAHPSRPPWAGPDARRGKSRLALPSSYQSAAARSPRRPFHRRAVARPLAQRVPITQSVLEALPAESRTKIAVPGVFTPSGKQAPNSARLPPSARTAKALLWPPFPLTTKTLLLEGVKSLFGSKYSNENLQKRRAPSPPHMLLLGWQFWPEPTATCSGKKMTGALACFVPLLAPSVQREQSLKTEPQAMPTHSWEPPTTPQ